MKARSLSMASAAALGVLVATSSWADPGLVLDLSGGLAFRPGTGPGGLSSPGTGLRLDLGVRLGRGVSAVGTLWWSTYGATEGLPRCIDCPRIQSLNAIVSGIALRYGMTYRLMDFFLQGGPGVLVDFVDEVGAIYGRRSYRVHQIGFLGTAGLGIAYPPPLHLGLRFDSLLAGDQHILGVALFVGVRF